MALGSFTGEKHSLLPDKIANTFFSAEQVKSQATDR